MKRVLIVTVIALILAFVTVGLAQGYGGPHGGDYAATTDACAGCHRAHTATHAGLLMESSYALCMSCHGSSASGANTNVDDGYYLSTRDDVYDHGAAETDDYGALLGGGFVNYQGKSVTSIHSPYGGDEVAWAWGNGVPRGELGALDEALDCASCHDPHGSTNYRILKTEINGADVSVALVDEGDAKDYDDEQWGAGTSSVCAACHGAYHVTWAGSGHIRAEGETTFAHRVDMSYLYHGNDNPETIGLDGYYLPLAQSGSGNLVVCMTCHLPHGSSSVMQGSADGDGLPGETSDDDSALLRLDNRGVCQVCHQK